MNRCGPVKRFTQDSPVMPDVWLEYGKHPGERIDLLLTPHTRSSAGKLCRAVRERMAEEVKTDHWKTLHGDSEEPDLAYNQSTVGAWHPIWQGLSAGESPRTSGETREPARRVGSWGTRTGAPPSWQPEAGWKPAPSSGYTLLTHYTNSGSE